MLANIHLRASRKFSLIMNIPGQITVNAMIGDGVESVISFTDDEQSIWSLGDSRWEPEESMPPANTTSSPKVPRRRGSVVPDPSTAVDLPKLPRRRGTMVQRAGSNDSGSIARLSKASSSSPSPVRRRNNPPRFPNRKHSQEGVPLAKYKDLVKAHSRRNMIKQQSIQRDMVKQHSARQVAVDLMVKQASVPRSLASVRRVDSMVKQHSVPGEMVKQPSARKVDSPNLKMATAA